MKLEVIDGRLSLCSDLCAPLAIDYDDYLAKRPQSSGLLRACKPKPGMRIIDATAGWGRDAAVLAHAGAHVLMIERNPILAALHEDALARCGLLPHDAPLPRLVRGIDRGGQTPRHCEDPKRSEGDEAIQALSLNSTHDLDCFANARNDGVVARAGSHPTLPLSFIQADAVEYLKSLSPKDTPDLIYLDPMHPTRQKTAKVKKEMQVLQALYAESQPNPDAYHAEINELLTTAREKAPKVVLKWPAKAKFIQKPAYSVPGKTVRFDIFV